MFPTFEIIVHCTINLWRISGNIKFRNVAFGCGRGKITNKRDYELLVIPLRNYLKSQFARCNVFLLECNLWGYLDLYTLGASLVRKAPPPPPPPFTPSSMCPQTSCSVPANTPSYRFTKTCSNLRWMTNSIYLVIHGMSNFCFVILLIRSAQHLVLLWCTYWIFCMLNLINIVPQQQQ